MYIAMNRFQIAEGREEVFEEIWRKRDSQLEGVPGFRDFHLIGLHNKIRAYELQDQGHDTVEANRALGFKPDLRDYGIGAQILLDLGLNKIRLLTNNPRKIVGLEGYNLKITGREPLYVNPGEHNQEYLDTKRSKLGHLL